MREFINITEGWTDQRQPKKYIAKGTADTAGDGFWSTVEMDNIKINVLPAGEFWQDEDDPGPVGHLRANFNSRVWNVDRHGLIYTDSKFESDVKRLLKAAGFKHFNDINYSEQGMQGETYVDFDCGHKLANELNDKGFITVVPYEEWRG